MEQGYRSFWIRSHAETIARGQDLANLIYYRNTIAPSTDLTQPIAISLIPTSFRHRFKVYRGGEGGGGGGGGRGRGEISTIYGPGLYLSFFAQ